MQKNNISLIISLDKELAPEYNNSSGEIITNKLMKTTYNLRRYFPRLDSFELYQGLCPQLFNFQVEYAEGSKILGADESMAPENDLAKYFDNYSCIINSNESKYVKLLKIKARNKLLGFNKENITVLPEINGNVENIFKSLNKIKGNKNYYDYAEQYSIEKINDKKSKINKNDEKLGNLLDENELLEEENNKDLERIRLLTGGLGTAVEKSVGEIFIELGATKELDLKNNHSDGNFKYNDTYAVIEVKTLKNTLNENDVEQLSKWITDMKNYLEENNINYAKNKRYCCI